MPDSVCIIGHGTGVDGRRLGNQIDSYDLVIRMTECDWQNPTDYGNKYDVGVYATGSSKRWSKKSERKPDKEYWYYHTGKDKYKEDYQEIFKDKKIRHIRRTVWDLVDRKVSRGTMAIMTALEYYNPEEIALVGFTAIQNSSFNRKHHPSKLSQYLNQKFNRVERRCLLDTHDWEYENILIDKLSDMYNTDIHYL